MSAGQHPLPVDFDQAPFIVIWETTKACDLACLHCRAEAATERDREELSTEEGKRVITESAEMGSQIFVLSGGDPLKRPDLEELVAHAGSVGLRIATIPAATPLLCGDRVRALAAAGLTQIAFSIDGPDPVTHDGFRGVNGSFRRTLMATSFAREVGLPLQINTCFGSWNFKHFEAMAKLVTELEVAFWEVFFLVPTGRGSTLEGLSPPQYDQIFDGILQLAHERNFVVKITEAPHYRRFVADRECARTGNNGDGSRVRPAPPAAPVNGGIGLSPYPVNSGKGFLFVGHTGDIMPSGFLPITAGNIRTDRLADVYRQAPIFVDLRRADRLTGRCGLCRYSAKCGGSRAHAYAATGDYLAEDPSCTYPV